MAKEQEYDFALLRAGGKKAEKEWARLLEGYKGFIITFSMKYLGKLKQKGINISSEDFLEDLKRDATIGMMKAVETYDESTPFMPWAAIHMRNCINKNNNFDKDAIDIKIEDFNRDEDYAIKKGKSIPFSPDVEERIIRLEEAMQEIRTKLNDEEFEIFCRFRGLDGHEAEDMAKIAKDMKISLTHARCAYSHSKYELGIDDD